MSDTEKRLVNPHPDFEKRKQDGWDAFLSKDYEETAKIAARMLQDSFALDAIHLAGLALTALDRGAEGFEWLVASLALANAKPDWYANAAIACMDKKDYLHAMLFISNGIEEYPDDIRLSYMRGLAMCHTQCWDNAVRFLDETLAIDPDFYHAKMSKGFALHLLGRYEEAIECYKSIKHLATTEDLEEIINNQACVLLELGRTEEALELLDTECAGSQRPGTLYNKSFLWLGMGKWPEGWDLYRNRATVQMIGGGSQGIPSVDQPKANSLDDLKDKSVFLFHEQGLGDSLQFIRYAHLIRPLVSELTIGVPKPLRRLAECLNLDQPFTVVADADLDKPVFSKCDVAVPMLDAPWLFKTTVETIPAQVPYFNIPQDVINRNLLPDTCKPLVGLIWAGASREENIRAHAIDKRRSIPFEMLEPILALWDKFQFVSLQLPDHRVDDFRLIQPLCPELVHATQEQLDNTPDAVAVPLSERFDVLDTAGIVKQLDLLITIDSSIAHLAGAIGKPVWMLSRYDGCWRWLWDGRDDTNWYPTMKIWRQKTHNTWPEVIARVAVDLKKLSEFELIKMERVS